MICWSDTRLSTFLSNLSVRGNFWFFSENDPFWHGIVQHLAWCPFFYLISAIYTVKPVQSDHPLVQTKAIFVDRWPLFAGSTHWSNAKLWMKEVTGKKKYHKDHKQRSKREIAKVGFLPEHFLACRQTFVGELHKKGDLRSSHGRSKQGKQADGARKTRGRFSRKAGGRYSQCSFCMKLSVHKKVVVWSRWSLFAVVAEARFYCMSKWTFIQKMRKIYGMFVPRLHYQNLLSAEGNHSGSLLQSKISIWFLQFCEQVLAKGGTFLCTIGAIWEGHRYLWTGMVRLPSPFTFFFVCPSG